MTTFLLGAASGMATNLVSGATAYRAIAASVTLAALLTASTRLRGLPPGAPIVRYGVRFMLALGLSAVVLTSVGPPNLAPYAIFGAVVLTGAAVLVHADRMIRIQIAAGIASVGVGVVFVSGVILIWQYAGALGRGYVSIGITFAVIGVASLVGGTAFLRGHDQIGGAALATAGIAILVGGITTLSDYRHASGIAFAGVGVALAGGGITFVAGHNRVRRIALIGVGAAVIVGGVIFLNAINPIGGMALVGVGIAVIIGGMTFLTGHDFTRGMAVVGFGVAGVVGGITYLADRNLVLGVAGVGLGSALIGSGISLLARTERASRAKRWLMSLTTEPAGLTEQQPLGD